MAMMASAGGSLPEVVLTKDNTVVRESCRVVIPPGVTIADGDGDGVLKIEGSDLTVEFAGASELWGGARPTADGEGAWDGYAGVGVRVMPGSRNVTLRNLRVHGYKVGVLATDADGLVVDAADLSDNFRQRLRSTPIAEDSSDWLFPHHNDGDEWATKWGAALSIRGGRGVTVRNVKVRRGQNGIMLHRVEDSRVYDNDCSFLSGWGLAMFRSSRNVVTRNAFDFCVRGHVEGVYNRGQDSAGILMFEQCSGNLIAENSATHSGDGIFGFAGLEALNAEGVKDAAGYDHTRKGCNDNVFVGNDLSYAPAHGLEMTFSFGNRIVGNRFVENAICGIWGGYSRDTLIAGNEFVGNGGMAYGMERGGVNMEHAAGNTIVANRFVNNKAGVHLWWDPHGDFEEKTWGKVNYVGLAGNVVAGNTFVIDGEHPFGVLRAGKMVGVQLREVGLAAGAASRFSNTVYAGNTVTIEAAIGVEIDAATGIALDTGAAVPAYEAVAYEALGRSRPVGVRTALVGRSKIVMGEWGPWDHASVLFRARSLSGGEHVYEVFGASGTPEVKLDSSASDGVSVTVMPVGEGGLGHRIAFAGRPGVSRYAATVRAGSWSRRVEGLLVGASWDVRVFAWGDATEPKENLAAWRAEAASERAGVFRTGVLRFDYGHGGPRDQVWGKELGEKAPGGDRFGMVATAKIRFPKGSWKFSTLSDDGVRVTTNGKAVIENWTWHAPTRDEGVLTLEQEAEVEVLVEHFEINGYAVLQLEISPA
jgi:parallel beta-helix repeat protein